MPKRWKSMVFPSNGITECYVPIPNENCWYCRTEWTVKVERTENVPLLKTIL